MLEPTSKPARRFISAAVFLLFCTRLLASTFDATNIPLPEHPRPDFQRQHWFNLNGPWEFCFDKEDQGVKERWYLGQKQFPLTIMVPFPWGSKLSGVNDEGDIGWYGRKIQIPAAWEGLRVFLVVGACDWHTTAWLDGKEVGTYQGGYTQFEFELTKYVKPGKGHRLTLRVDDGAHPFKLEGKQGYGRAAGIWQTVYLEARPPTSLQTIHFTPDVDAEKVIVDVTLDGPASGDVQFALVFKPQDRRDREVNFKIDKGSTTAHFDVPLANPRLWSLEDPYLYEVQAVVVDAEGGRDTVDTYFGMRKIGVVTLPGTGYRYVALNDKPVYLQLTLDQGYHPDGYYTFPSDDFMRDEILRTRRIGLNGQRIHVKIDAPRKLYWADRLGVLIMADVPNSWGRPDEQMRKETETALRGMLRRDYNHPSIFSWVIFNETWGLKSGRDGYLPETQDWVESLYRLTKQLDPTRLVEDNSPCNLDHVATDLNTWHAYLPGYAWPERLDKISRDTFVGSKWNYIGGRTQGNEPMLNSECGNVWGYQGSAGDVDWSWDYHLMINAFRRHPKICGWLYTEHHDVINEWNGYYRFDRSDKYTGLDGIVPGMGLNDLHGPFYLATEQELCRKVRPGERVEAPLYASFVTDRAVGDELVLRTELYGWDSLGRFEMYSRKSLKIGYEPWLNKELKPIRLAMPSRPALAVLALILEDGSGAILHRNFTTYLVAEDSSPRQEILKGDGRKIRVVRFAPDSFKKAYWPVKQWNVLDGLKVNGAGAGYFEFEVAWPKGLRAQDVTEATIRLEASAKQLFGKDREGAGKQQGDFMRGKGTHDPSLNPNAYPMTDETSYPSAVRIRIGGRSLGVFDLPDDPADHRGILSWQAQKRDNTLTEAGSYGYLVDARIPRQVLRQAAKTGTLVVRLEVDDAVAGGVAIYGERFGRYPLDPTLAFVLK
ncbi:MAG: hypothetical protein JSU94_04050 [Phycisphaerales bacterium]|nr:MAG: hypothetical protein JSU94_04050 [Phycisphaerales bacterium]